MGAIAPVRRLAPQIRWTADRRLSFLFETRVGQASSPVLLAAAALPDLAVLLL
jgi:hypothetical protein